jgi:methionyl-tRNA synthetase
MEDVDIEDFKRLDIRIGTILEAEDIKGSDRLMKLIVDIGEKRQLVAGFKAWYSPEDLPGKKVVVLANLEPVKLFGVESQGMVLAAQDDKTVSLLTIDRDIENGLKVR